MNAGIFSMHRTLWSHWEPLCRKLLSIYILTKTKKYCTIIIALIIKNLHDFCICADISVECKRFCGISKHQGRNFKSLSLVSVEARLPRGSPEKPNIWCSPSAAFLMRKPCQVSEIAAANPTCPADGRICNTLFAGAAISREWGGAEL